MKKSARLSNMHAPLTEDKNWPLRPEARRPQKKSVFLRPAAFGFSYAVSNRLALRGAVASL
jgi:hypothetical protein